MTRGYPYPLGATTPTPAPAPAPAAAIGDPYWLGSDVAIAAPFGATVVQLQVQDHGFKAYKLVATSLGAFSTLIKKAGRQLSNQAIHSDCLWGTAADPMELEQPLVFAKGDIVEITIADLSGAPNNISFSFIGVQTD
jgi:hypothetical protein